MGQHILSAGNEKMNTMVLKVLVSQLNMTLCDSMDCSPHQAPLSMEFSRQAYWSGQSFSSPGDLPNTELEPRSLTLQADSLPSEPAGT